MWIKRGSLRAFVRTWCTVSNKYIRVILFKNIWKQVSWFTLLLSCKYLPCIQVEWYKYHKIHELSKTEKLKFIGWRTNIKNKIRTNIRTSSCLKHVNVALIYGGVHHASGGGLREPPPAACSGGYKALLSSPPRHPHRSSHQCVKMKLAVFHLGMAGNCPVFPHVKETL